MRDRLLSAYISGRLIEELTQVIHETAHDKDTLPALLVELHNSGLLDLVLEFRGLKKKSERPHSFFLLRHLFERVLPEIIAPVGEVMKCVHHLYHEAGRDMVAGHVLLSFETFLGKSQTRCDECLQEIEGKHEYADLLVVTLTAGFRFNGTAYLKHLRRISLEPALRNQALYALQRAQLESADVAQDALQFLEEVADEDASDSENAIVVACGFALLGKHPGLAERIEPLLLKIIPRRAHLTVHAAADALAWKTELLRSFPKTLNVVIRKVRHIDSSNEGTVTILDHGLASLLKTADRLAAMSAIEELLKQSRLSIDQLPAFSSEVAADSSLKNTLLCRWLRLGDPALCLALQHLARESVADEFPFAVDRHEIDATDDLDLFLMARRAIGYLFSWPALPLRIVLSLAREIRDESRVPEVLGLALDPLLLNHPRLLDGLAKEIDTAEPRLRSHLCDIETAMRLYIAELQSIGPIPELHVSVTDQESYSRRMDRMMKNSLREHEKNSPLMSLIRRSVLLFGRSSIFHQRTASGASRRVEAPLHQMEHHVELPRMLTLDPLSLEFTLATFRAGRRKHETHN